MKKKLLVSLLSISLLLAGCGEQNSGSLQDPGAIGEEYANLIKNYTPLEKDPSKTVNDPEFEAFLDQIFKDAASESYTFMHSSVTDYKKLGLTKPEVSWGKIKYNDLEKVNEYIDDLKALQAFDYSKLSYRQQYDYDMYQYSLYETIADSAYSKYYLPFSSANDQASSIVSYLTDFTFYDQESIDDYILLLDDTDRYLKDLEKYIKAQAKDGIYHNNEAIDFTQEYITNFTSLVEDNAIIKAFEASMNDIAYLTHEKKDEYIAKVKNFVTKEIIPEFKKVSTTLEAQRNKSKLSGALCNYDDTYAEVEFMLASSSNKTMEDLYNDLVEVLNVLMLDFTQENYDQVGDAYYLIGNLFGTDYQAYLDNLKKFAYQFGYYPDLGEAKYDIDLMDASSASSSVLAYYWPSPLDNTNQNIIRVNPNTLGDDLLTTYTTLAHEGFPGHLYQHIYFLKQNPHNFRETQGFGGYTEGYAVRAQHDALEFLLGDISLANFLFYYTSSYFIEYSMIDIGINYLGWDIDTTENYLTSTLHYNEGYGETFHDFLISNATSYCSYGMGYAEMTLLRNKAQKALGDKFDLAKFNQAILENGPLPFVLLEQAVDYYIEENN